LEISPGWIDLAGELQVGGGALESGLVLCWYGHARALPLAANALLEIALVHGLFYYYCAVDIFLWCVRLHVVQYARRCHPKIGSCCSTVPSFDGLHFALWIEKAETVRGQEQLARQVIVHGEAIVDRETVLEEQNVNLETNRGLCRRRRSYLLGPGYHHDL